MDLKKKTAVVTCMCRNGFDFVAQCVGSCNRFTLTHMCISYTGVHLVHPFIVSSRVHVLCRLFQLALLQLLVELPCSFKKKKKSP